MFQQQGALSNKLDAQLSSTRPAVSLDCEAFKLLLPFMSVNTTIYAFTNREPGQMLQSFIIKGCG